MDEDEGPSPLDNIRIKEEIIAREIVYYDLDIDNIVNLMENYKVKKSLEKTREKNKKNIDSWLPLYYWSMEYMKRHNLTKRKFCKKIGVEFYHHSFHKINAPTTIEGTVGAKIRAGIQKLRMKTEPNIFF